MSFNLKVVDDDDENDSFHSFVQSEADSFDLELDDLSNFDESDNISDEHEQSDNNLPNIRAVAQASFLAEDDKSASSEPELENSIEPILQAGNQSRPSVESIEEHKVCPINPGLTTSRKYYIDQYMVPEPSGNGSKPAMNLFNMSISNKEDVLDVSANTEALQKYAYTESWIEGQQKGSLRRRLSAALDGLFNKEDANRLGEEQPQENTVKPRNISPSSLFQNIPQDEPYVSPFEELPLQPVEKTLPGQKPFITVPAGYDLNQLVEYKDPNHWHRRATTRNDTRP